jgi:adenine-specific DNA-methyltransferase
VDKALNRFYVGQDADYFIHKDLQGFLTREKDRFIKNVLFSDLDALLDLRADAATRVLARAFNAVASRIIEFLDATETFQRNLFTLKKKVIDTHWLISLGKIPESFWPRLLQNNRLLAYWQNEFKQTVATPDELKALPTLVVDTSLFITPDERALIDDILSDPAFDHLDEQTDGLLIHSENWQALNLLQEKFRERVQCIYIDPPYNTGGDGFLYKDSFRHSSWAAMMSQGLSLAESLLSQTGILFVSIDENEKDRLKCIVSEIFSHAKSYEIIRTTGTPTAQGTTGLSNTFDSLFLVGKDERSKLFGLPLSEEDKLIYNQQDQNGRYLTRSLRMTGEEDRREDRPDMYYGVDAPDESTVYPIGPGGYESRWRLKKSEYLSRIEKGLIEWKFTASYDDSEDGAGENDLIQPPRWKPYIKFYMPESKSVQNLWGDIGGNKKGKRELKDVVGPVQRLTPKPMALMSRVIEISSSPGDIVLDFFSGTGTTAAAVLNCNDLDSSLRNRKWILCEFGDVFSLSKSRISRLSFTRKWKYGLPIQNGVLNRPVIIKVLRLEQYEDVIANLDTAWDEAALPEAVPLRYLFRPDQNRVRLSLNLARPFANTLKIGKAGEEQAVDLLETWALLQGYWVRSRKIHLENGRSYACLETECGCLVVLRDIDEPEDDSATLNVLAAGYVNTDGSRRIQRLEVNHWADLRRIERPCTLLGPTDFDRGAAWN